MNEFESLKAGLIESALTDLVGVGLLRQISGLTTKTSSPKRHWVLAAPLGLQGQQVGISIGFANELADFINAFHEASNTSEDQVDALNVTEQDIHTLLQIAVFLAQEDEDGGAGAN